MIAQTVPARPVTFCCPACLPTARDLTYRHARLICPVCGQAATAADGFIDFLNERNDSTGEHYTLQWGREKAFFQFLKAQPAAKSVMPAGQLGWKALFTEIRGRAARGPEPVFVYDAACGFG